MKKFIYIIFAAAVAMLAAGCEKPGTSEEKIFTIGDFAGQWGLYYENQLRDVIDISYTKQNIIILASPAIVTSTPESKADKIQMEVNCEISEYDIDQETGMLKFTTAEGDKLSFALISWDGNIYLSSSVNPGFGQKYTRVTETVEYLYPSE